MKAKNAKVGTRVQVKEDVSVSFSGRHGTIVNLSDSVWDARVNLDVHPFGATGFTFDELRRVK